MMFKSSFNACSHAVATSHKVNSLACYLEWVKLTKKAGSLYDISTAFVILLPGILNFSGQSPGNPKFVLRSPESRIPESRIILFTPKNNKHIDLQDSYSGQLLSDIVLSVSDVQEVLTNLDPNKACGPDNIPGRLLKITAAVISPSLCRLFNMSLLQ